MIAETPRILIIEDEFLIAEGLRLQLEDLGLQVCGVAATADEGVDMAVAEQPDVVLSDVRLGGARDGVDAAIEILSRMVTQVVFLTGSREPSTLERLRLAAPAPVLFKPVSDVKLRDTILGVLTSRAGREPS